MNRRASASVGGVASIGGAAVVVGACAFALPACPAGPGDCAGPKNNTVSVDGHDCDTCVVDFGAVEIGLQDHKRIDLQFGCDDVGFAGVNFVNGDTAFAIGSLQLPQAPGSKGFVDVTFTPSSTDPVTATIGIDPEKHATLKGVGKSP